MSTISVEQRFALLAKLGENMDWDSLTPEQVQVGIREAKRAGAGVTALVRNGFLAQVEDFLRETGEVCIQIPALARATLAELMGRIERDTSPINAVTLRLGTILALHEPRIDGKEYGRRIMPSLHASLGYQQACWLAEHQNEFPEFMALLGKFYIDFPGLLITQGDGRKYFPYLFQSGKRWDVAWRCVPTPYYQYGRIAFFNA